jgi:D-xylose 1-dehydrogenase (NADP+, D-xylono-1,5-lactone-forming)
VSKSSPNAIGTGLVGKVDLCDNTSQEVTMSRTKLQWGLLSTARINRAVINPIQKSKRGVLSAVASRDEAKARDFALNWGISRIFGSYEAMLADPEIDVIYNPLPNSLHSEWTIKAVQAGKHVLCEKPLATTSKEVDAMIEASQKTGKMIAEAFMYRHHPQTLKVIEMIQSGAIGSLRLVRSSFSFTLNRTGDVRLNAALGGGSIWDIGCYPVSYARHLIGAEPVEVFGWQVTGESGVDETFVGEMRFPGDIYAQFDCSFRMPFRMALEIVGSEGTITLKRPFTPRRVEAISLQQGDRSTRHLVRSGDLYSYEIEDMHAAILDGKAPRISLLDSRGTVQTIRDLLRSAEKNEPVLTGNIA